MITIRKVRLENFRSYDGDNNEMEISDLTALVGKNDAGKSTWLEALSIFFNPTGVCKPEANDLNIYSESGTFGIAVSFDLEDSQIVIDTANVVDAKEEYLLDSKGLLTIKKNFSSVTGKNSSSLIICVHPTSVNYSDLMSLKLTELKKRAKGLDISDDEVRIYGLLTTCSSFRKAIWANAKDLKLKEVEIAIDKGEGKDIIGAVSKELPIFNLFKVDRNNSDQDNEAQDPFEVAIKNVLNEPEVLLAIKNLTTLVKNSYSAIASSTIAELRLINPDIADELNPTFGEPKLEKSFKPSVLTDGGVPLNKRGSGVRRLVLLSFFCAEAKRVAGSSQGVIYAIEEPETSQHPEHQQILIQSLQSIAATANAQVLITTHSPQLLHDLPFESIRHVLGGSPIGESRISMGEDALFNTIMELGQLPMINSTCLICVEGKLDISFLRNLSMNIDELGSICDLTTFPFLDLGGGRLNNWADENPLELSNTKEFHLYDSDVPKYKDSAEKVNLWKHAHAVQTLFLEIENYCHPTLIKDFFSIDLTRNLIDGTWGRLDVVSKLVNTKYNKNAVKQIICGKLSNEITKTHLEELGAWDEVVSWFEGISKQSKLVI